MAFIRNDRVFQALRKKVGALACAKVKVGILEGGDDEVETEYGDLTITELATIHEFGAPNANIPERSFIRATFEGEGREELLDFQAEQAKQIVEGSLTPTVALKRIGAKGVAMVKARIRAHIDPPNRGSTIRRKGSSTPLVDTGHLIGSISFELEETGQPGTEGGKK